MERPTDKLAERATALAARVTELAWAGEAASLAEVMSGLTDTALIEVLERVGTLSRLLEAVGARAAGEFAARSRREVSEPLAKRLGSRSAQHGIAAIAHLASSTASEWCRVGEQLGTRRTLTGDILPDAHPTVAAALDTGSIGTDSARLILDTLTTVEPKAAPSRLAAWEEFLVGEALTEPTVGLKQACGALIAHADPEGVEVREEEMRAKAGITTIQRRNGMTRYVIDVDPESEGWIETGLDARTAPRRQVRFTIDEDQDAATDAAIQDSRTMAQKRLDALVSIMKDSIKHDSGDMSGIAATLLVGIDHKDLVAGIGAATIYGVDQPISARTARRIAADARIIPVVLGGDSQPLDLGQARRLFTESQRYAMALRDGGCVWECCDVAPGRCEAAHKKAWDQGEGQPHGPTDITNGVLLCPFHHRRFDNDGWDLENVGGIPHLIPPPWIDPTQRPRRAARPRLRE